MGRVQTSPISVVAVSQEEEDENNEPPPDQEQEQEQKHDQDYEHEHDNEYSNGNKHDGQQELELEQREINKSPEEDKKSKEGQEPHKESKREDGSLQLDELEDAVKVYDAIRTLRRRTEPAKDKQLEKEFDVRMAELAAGLKAGLQSASTSEMQKALVLKAKFALLDLSYAKMVEDVADPQAADIWRSLGVQQAKAAEGLWTVIMALKPKIEQDAGARKIEVAQAQQETQEVLRAAKQLEKEMQVHVQEKEDLKRHYDSEIAELRAHVSSLEDENRQYLDTIIKRSKAATVAGVVPRPVTAAKDSPDRMGKEAGREKKVAHRSERSRVGHCQQDWWVRRR